MEYVVTQQDILYVAIVIILRMEHAWNARRVILEDTAHHVQLHLSGICADLPVIVQHIYVTTSVGVESQQHALQQRYRYNRYCHRYNQQSKQRKLGTQSQKGFPQC